MSIENIQQDWSKMSVQEIFSVLRSSDKGLSKKESLKRLRVFGSNEVKKSFSFQHLNRFIKQFKSPVVFISVIAVIFTLWIESYADSVLILIVLTINVLIGFFQEEKASRAFKKLRMLQNRTATICRDGVQESLSVRNLVPGDVVLLRAGVRVGADIRILKAKDLEIDESILTGEWAPSAKNAITLIDDKPIFEKVNMAWSGTLVSNGTAKGIVVETGPRTKVGNLSNVLKTQGQKTPLQLQVQKIAKLIIALILLCVLLILFFGLLQGLSSNDIILSAVAVGIAGIPSGLPAVMTVILLFGSQALLKKGGLVRNLFATESLGSTTWILTDKTGTLTNGVMKLKKLISLDTKEVCERNISPLGKTSLQQAYLASDGQRQVKGIGTDLIGSPVEKAIVLGIESLTGKKLLANKDDLRTTYLPFKSKLRYSAAIFESENGLLQYAALGAPEVLIQKAAYFYTKEGEQKATNGMRRKMNAFVEEEGKKGRRVLALSQTTRLSKNFLDSVNEQGPSALEIENLDSTFVSLLSFEDELRDDVPDSVSFIKKANVNITMVTGDNENTALQIAKESGITDDTNTKVILGDAFMGLSDGQILQTTKDTKVFARMLPNQKLRLLNILQKNGEIVAMTGDGVNDAPALHSASIGVAVASGTEIARESSDLILLRNSFSTITMAIIEGRKIITNLKKALIYLLSTSFSEAILVSGAILFAAGIPVTPAQILWANIVEEAFIGFAFAFEKEDPDAAKKDPRNPEVATVINNKTKQAIIFLALATGLFLLAVFALLDSFTTLSRQEIQTIVFLTLSIDSIFFVFSLKRLNKSIFKTNIFDNLWLIGAALISIGLLVLSLTSEFLANILGNVAIPPIFYLVIPITAIFHMTIIEMVKKYSFSGEYKG